MFGTLIDTTTFTPWSFFTDLGLIFFLLLIGKLIRVKIKLVQQLFIPPSLIAGILGLAFGPNGLGWLPFSNNLGTYASVMIALVFASLALSSPKIKIKEVASKVGPMWVFSQIGMLIQWGLAGLFGLFVMKAIWPSLNDAFGVMLSTGFYGGHGTAAAIGGAFNNLGWDEATSLGMTTATVGVICAVLGGLVLIKIATKKHVTSFVTDFKDLPDELRHGLLPEEKRDSVGASTTSSISIEALTFHMGFVFVAAFLGYVLSLLVKHWYPGLELPVFSCAFVTGLIIKSIGNRCKYSDYIDCNLTQRVGSFFTDLLVACGVAAINLGVVVKYAVPLIVLIVFGIVLVLAITFYFGRHLSKTYWFERSIFAWGWWTGTMAMGIALIRIVDPKMQSKAMDDYALAYLPVAPVEILLITCVPLAFSAGWSLWLLLGCLALSAILLGFAASMGWWRSSTCDGK